MFLPMIESTPRHPRLAKWRSDLQLDTSNEDGGPGPGKQVVLGDIHRKSDPCVTLRARVSRALYHPVTTAAA